MAKEPPLFPLRKGRHSRQAHVDLPAGTFEEEHARQGFFGRTTHLYRLHPTTDWTRIEGPLRPHSYDLNDLTTRADAAIRASMRGSTEDAFAPICLLHNSDVALHWVAPKTMDFLYRNADGDDVYYIHAGGGKLETTFGALRYATGDYLVIPRGTTYRFLPDGSEQRYLLIESAGEVTIPDRNQLGPNAIFDPAMIDTPELEDYVEGADREPEAGAEGHFAEGEARRARPMEGPREWAVHIKRENEITKVYYPFNPNDVVGWKGDLTVWRINVKDIRPINSHRYHLPPSAHTTFIAPNFVICSFLPRPFEEEEGAMRVPFYHINIDYDEVLFYSDGHFFSREGIGAGMMTWHPQGIHHGPHPKAIPKSREKDRTDEVAVMLDTARPLKATPAAALVENLNYWASWK